MPVPIDSAILVETEQDEDGPVIRGELLAQIPVFEPGDEGLATHEAPSFLTVSRLPKGARPVELTLGSMDDEVNDLAGEWDFVLRISKNAARTLGQALLKASKR